VDHARERDAAAREAERRSESQEALAAARDRLAHVTAEAASAGLPSQGLADTARHVIRMLSSSRNEGSECVLMT
jgi:hypothetical protein